MLKTKLVFSAFVLFVAMTLATEAFAQATFSISSTPTSRLRDDGHTEIIGNITIRLTDEPGDSGTDEGSVTLAYADLPITNTQGGGPDLSNIQIFGSGCFAGAAANGEDGGSGNASAGLYEPGATTPNDTEDPDATISHLDGVIVLTLPAIDGGTKIPADGLIACSGPDDAIFVQNVHGSVVSAGAAPLRAIVSVDPGSNYQIVSGADTPTIVSSILDPLAQNALDLGDTASIRADGEVTDAEFSFTITENYFDALMSEAQLSGGAQNAVRVYLEFSNLPDGVSLTGLATDLGTLSDDTVDNDDDTVFIEFDGDDGPPDSPEQSSVDEIEITGEITFTGDSGDLPIDATDAIQVVAFVGPAGSLGISSSTGLPDEPEVGNFPRFDREDTDPITIAGAVTAETTLLIPYGVVHPDLNYDTGIAIANTTADDDRGAVAQSGTILFQMWAQDGTMTEWETTEVIDAGESWIRLLSDVLANAGTTLPFQGYVIITTDFTHAHAGAFISDFAGFTAMTPVLVLEGRAAIPESLGF